MTYPRFSLCVKLASQLLLTSNSITSFPFDPKQLNLGPSVIIDSVQNYSKLVGMELHDSLALYCEDGLAIRSNKRGINLILYNEEINNTDRINWTLAHEIGHIVLNHLDEISNDIQEVEAHYFAANLIMPTPIIVALSRKGLQINEESLRWIFGVSHEAASRKMNTIRKWDHYRETEYDNALIHKFNDFIESFSIPDPFYISDGYFMSY